MGWGGGRFPTIAQLNLLTATPKNREALFNYFQSIKNKYQLGDICSGWTNGPWIDDTDHPYHPLHAKIWKRHIQRDLDAKDRKKLEKEIGDAIDNRWQILYKFVQNGSESWTVDSKADQASQILEITVTGPGW
jgi:hypothetical protein